MTPTALFFLAMACHPDPVDLEFPEGFVWGAEGFRSRFGLYRVDYDTYARTATEGADVFARITADDGIRRSLLEEYGGEVPR